ncbi:MAG: hypothetical protein AAFQ94_25650 [Bacteroidota bacterium]
MRYIILLFCLIFHLSGAFAQKSLSDLLSENKSDIQCQNQQFSGEGWNQLIEQVKKHEMVLIGEDHFFNEVPLFVSQIAKADQFDNFFCEIDPYSADVISDKIRSFSAEKLNKYTQNIGSTFSFFALEPEFDLLKQLTNDGAKIFGTDQIVLIADRLLASELIASTKSKEAKAIYADIIQKSAEHFERFKKQQGSPYFFTDEFMNNLNKLEGLPLSDFEKSVISDLKLSRKIYTTQDHYLRIQLMKNNVLKHYEELVTGKSLFKYGGIHSGKGESLLGGYDIGNLVSNLADGNFQSSLHIMIIGKSGMQGVPFKGLSPQPVNPNSKNLKFLKSFFDETKGSDWALFDLQQISKGVKKNKIAIEGNSLQNMLAGYDYLVVIPEVTAAGFME